VLAVLPPVVPLLPAAPVVPPAGLPPVLPVLPPVLPVFPPPPEPPVPPPLPPNFSQLRWAAPLNTRYNFDTPAAAGLNEQSFVAHAFEVDPSEHLPSDVPSALSWRNSTVASAAVFTRSWTVLTPASP
jgi:hypothetical protein